MPPFLRQQRQARGGPSAVTSPGSIGVDACGRSIPVEVHHSAGWTGSVGDGRGGGALAWLLPAMAKGRFESRKVACQDQLRQFGTALTQYVIRSPQERLPAVSESGPEAFAGMYAVRLKSLD